MLREKLANDISTAVLVKQSNVFGGFMNPTMYQAGAGAVDNIGNFGLKHLNSGLKHLNYGREASVLYEPAQTAIHVLNKTVDKLPLTATTTQTIGGPLVRPTTFGKFLRAGVRDLANPIDKVLPLPFFPKNLAKQTWESFGSPLWKAMKGRFGR